MTAEWTPVFVLPNIPLEAAIGCDIAALAPAHDRRVATLKLTHPKAPIDTPRRAMGDLLGHAVRFGVVGKVMAAGEGIETMLSLRMALPTMPMAAALSAAHLSAILFPDTLRRLYIARDNEQAQRRGQREQDDSEVKAVELERLTAEGQTMIERRNAFELMRDISSATPVRTGVRAAGRWSTIAT